jgi:m7GpppX diphosphatase
MRTGERRLITETPEMHTSHPMQSYISKEVSRPCKQWIHEVLSCRREAERVKLRTPDFVLLPDVECIGKRPRNDTKHPLLLILDQGRQWRAKRPPETCFHWLAVATDTNLRTLRDLRGGHVPMLQSLYTQTCQRIQEETGVEPNQIMAYIHYPPSVYQLHVHFKHLAWGPHDTLRVHPLPAIINNLRIDPDYYTKSLLQVPVYTHTDLYLALGPDPQIETVREIEKEIEKEIEREKETVKEVENVWSDHPLAARGLHAPE